jgi:hypothetical protein
MRLLVGLLSLSLSFTAPVFGQAPDPAVPSANPPAKIDPADARALAANYELASADNARKCAITLETRRVAGGLALAYNRPQCTQLFSFLSNVAAWSPGVAGAILFIDAGSHIVAEFTEGVGGIYEAIREGDAVYFLANLQFVDPAGRAQITDLFGDWNLSRPGGASICRITLSDKAAGEEMFAVRVQDGCDDAIARFGPVAWRLDRGDVLLLSQRGEALRFERQEGGGWAKVPAAPRPLLMARP